MAGAMQCASAGCLLIGMCTLLLWLSARVADLLLPRMAVMGEQASPPQNSSGTDLA